ncbi:MAG TPA: thioredoxin domain-containing protein [Pyrinomonadaceae bacterium]|jgi:protein-disulfide isomerase|nr:thioredoxin domain-containing protein [Pyrinomonadaceae bacterium]
MKKILPFIIILLVLGVALVSAWALKKRSSGTVTPITNNPNSPPHANTNDTVVTGVAGAEPPHILGPNSAPAKLEEFGDFECPPCGALHPILVQMHKEFGDKLQITFREFPLAPAHQHAIAAASAAEAAGLQGKFWEMHDLLYENQKAWHEAFDVRPIFEGFAKQIGLDMNRYQNDLNSDQVAERILNDGKRGHSMGVKGTPTVFLNGREVPFESLPSDKLRVLINLELTNHR